MTANEKIAELERRLTRIETAIVNSPISLPTDAPTLSAAEREEIERRAAAVREQAASRPRYEHDGTLIEPTAA